MVLNIWFVTLNTSELDTLRPKGTGVVVTLQNKVLHNLTLLIPTLYSVVVTLQNKVLHNNVAL